MRFKKQSDYALRVLMYLATVQGDSTTIKEIAQSFGISQNHLMKVVQSLRQSGFVKTQRGNKGGIRLGQPAEQIKIGQVLRKVGEQNELAECFIQVGHCKIDRICQLKPALAKANDAFFEVLDGYSLADILGSPRAMSDLLRLGTRV